MYFECFCSSRTISVRSIPMAPTEPGNMILQRDKDLPNGPVKKGSKLTKYLGLLGRDNHKREQREIPVFFGIIEAGRGTGPSPAEIVHRGSR